MFDIYIYIYIYNLWELYEKQNIRYQFVILLVKSISHKIEKEYV